MQETQVLCVGSLDQEIPWSRKWQPIPVFFFSPLFPDSLFKKLINLFWLEANYNIVVTWHELAMRVHVSHHPEPPSHLSPYSIPLHSSILAWKLHEQRSLMGCSPWSCKESDTTEQAPYGKGEDKKVWGRIQSWCHSCIKETLTLLKKQIFIFSKCRNSMCTHLTIRKYK